MSRTNENDCSAAPMSGVVLEIWTERVRQVHAEGYTPDQDDRHQAHELSRAANAYIEHAEGDAEFASLCWPWSLSTFKPSTPRAGLIKAAALLIAEIERQDRAAARAAA